MCRGSRDGVCADGDPLLFSGPQVPADALVSGVLLQCSEQPHILPTIPI